jgi:hypothetical protein
MHANETPFGGTTSTAAGPTIAGKGGAPVWQRRCEGFPHVNDGSHCIHGRCTGDEQHIQHTTGTNRRARQVKQP